MKHLSQGYTLSSCLTSMKGQSQIKGTIVKKNDSICSKILRCCIYPAKNIYEQDKFHAQLREHSGLSGRVLDSRRKGRGYELHRLHCVVSLSKNIYPCLVLVQPRKTCPFITERLLMDRKESNQTKHAQLS